MATIEPGIIVDIIFAGDETKNQIPSLQSIIYDTKDRRLILSQTTPPITDAGVGKKLLVTFIDKNDGTSPRYGFWAKLTELWTDYEISSSQRVPALILQRETGLETYNLRMSYRIRPLMDRGLTIYLQGKPIDIIDISVGGVRISSKIDHALKSQDIIKLTISIDDRKFDVESQVIRVWSSQIASGVSENRHFASIQFRNQQAARESLLGRKILLLERELLTQRIR